MAIRGWKRMREQARAAGTDAPDDRANPWLDPADDATPRLSDLGAPRPAGDTSTTGTPDDGERAAQYAEWAERMRTKRERTRAMVDGTDGEPAAPRAHWSTDALFAESRLVEEQEVTSRPNPWKTRELLSTLDLDEGASLDDIGSAYRRLAKTHHPDRYLDADEETRDFHAQKMLDINAAYRSLKALHTADR